MRIAVVVPRYGSNIVGGAETLLRHYAERLAAAGHQVEAITTTAVDHVTWRNVLPEGEHIESGVRVRRFAVSHPKDFERMAELHARLDAGFPLDRPGERLWLQSTGRSDALLHAVDEAGRRVDALLFAPYLFWATVEGARLHPDRSLIVPCLHDEPYARFAEVAATLRGARGLLCNTETEARLALRLIPDLPEIRVVGAGFTPPTTIAPAEDALAGTAGPLVTYAGRREAAKNVPLLVAWTAAHSQVLRPDRAVTLAVMGSGALSVPPGARAVVRDLGVVSEATKLGVMAASIAVAQLSVHESFSYALMEGWTCGTPSIVHAECEVTREHCERSGGGLWVGGVEEFSEAVSRLVADPALCRRLGAAGRAYVETEYSWPHILTRLETAIVDLVGVRSGAP